MFYIKVVNKVNPKSSHHKEKIFFSISSNLYVYERMDLH